MSEENNTQSILVRDLLRKITIDRSDEEITIKNEYDNNIRYRRS